MTEPAPWIVDQEALYADCKIFKVFKQQCRHPHDNREGVFFVIRCPDWVMALPVTTDGRLVLVRQFRFGTRSLSWEPPGGLLDHGENPTEAAVRELEEETGYVGKNARIIGTCAPNPAILGNTSHFVLIENCESTGTADFDVNEEVETRLFSAPEVEQMAMNGEIHHAIAQAGILHLRNTRPDLFQPKK
ncbi:MAG: NUDIX hydrolase [Puniceicoccales bacterium]|jgi:8-oxo-dGTP pyrophosphatase MutT (NUDIX family)|nr:NUDIX hydrolase [Puniceicoccales bacterium]